MEPRFGGSELEFGSQDSGSHRRTDKRSVFNNGFKIHIVCIKSDLTFGQYIVSSYSIHRILVEACIQGKASGFAFGENQMN